MVEPPSLLGLLCTRAAVSGGTSLLVDGRHVAGALLKSYPDAFNQLLRPESVRFGESPGI
jgi:hypothetical protein